MTHRLTASLIIAAIALLAVPPVHRQLVSVSARGHIATMAEPTNNFRHTFVYRRQ